MALVSSATYGLVAVVDKRLLDKHVPSLSAYFLWVAIATFIYGVIFLAANDLSQNVSLLRLLMGIISGLCWGGALAMMFWGFKLQEVSRASAVLFTFPVFVAILASMFLGESLIAAQWLAIAVVVFGAFLVSFNGSPRDFLIGYNRFWNPRGNSRLESIGLTMAFPILIGSSILTALGHVTGKYALQELSVPLVTSFGFFGTSVVLAIFWKPEAFTELRHAMRTKEGLFLLILSEGILVPIAVTTMISAMKLGPISLVAPITSTRPIFVFVYSTILSVPGIRLLDESIDRKALTVKLASVVIIISGILSLQ